MAARIAAENEQAYGGGEGGKKFIPFDITLFGRNTSPSLASRLNKRADLLRRILSFHEMKKPSLDYIDLRSSSKLFHRALHQPPPLWTSFPCSNHATLQSLVDRLEELRGDEDSSGSVPSVLFIEEGIYGGEGMRCVEEDTYQHCYYQHYQDLWEPRLGSFSVEVKKPLSIYGAGRGKTTLVGFGLKIKGEESKGTVEIEDLTIKGAKKNGLCVIGKDFYTRGLHVIMRRCSIEDCQEVGVFANNADISCDDLQVVDCGESGVYAYVDATITLSGQGTSIQRNGTKGYYSDSSEIYNVGLRAYSDSSEIHLVHPLTKEQISTNNRGGNWGGRGNIFSTNKYEK